jgi:hypothetical protein
MGLGFLVMHDLAPRSFTLTVPPGGLSCLRRRGPGLLLLRGLRMVALQRSAAGFDEPRLGYCGAANFLP